MVDENAPSYYIFNFYLDIENLSVCTATYLNLLVDFHTKYGNADDEKMEKVIQEDKEAILNSSKNARFWVMRSFVHFSALSEKISVFKTSFQEIKEKYLKITKQNPIVYSDLEDYLIRINVLFVQGIAQKELKDAFETYGKINSEWNVGE